MGEVDCRSGSGGDNSMGRAAQISHGVGAKVNRAFFVVDNIAQRFMWVCNITLVAGLMSVTWFAADRVPPFAMLSVEPAIGWPGDYLTIQASVKRDATRDCSAEFSRFIFDANGSRYDLGTSTASADMIKAMEAKRPGKLLVTVKLPESIHPGPAKLTTVLEYRCNKVHRIWPIEVTLQMPFTVLQ